MGKNVHGSCGLLVSRPFCHLLSLGARSEVEGFNQFTHWLFFGKDGVITENDPEEQEKRLKYLDVVACAVILQNAVDISWAIQSLHAEGHKVDRESLAVLSLYMTRQLKRFGDYVVDLQPIPQPLETAISLPVKIAES
ncbi:Tn3 family transposase [Trichocoleus desertorum]|uniref:Tn3 family transposase n=1 Tax=Trichocoleus TaxID=450526 RepID=UPI001A7EDEA0